METTTNPPAPGQFNRAILFAAFAVVVLLRIPNVLLQGRFFGEEGTYFFAYAWHMDWREALFHPLGGYLNLVASGGTLLAKELVSWGAIPLEGAPFVTALIALAFQLCPALLIVTARDPWLAPRLAKPAALLLIAAAPMAHEVWLHTLHSQFHLTICVALIVACAIPDSRRLRAFRLFLLLLAPLCGPSAIVLLPFLGLRALVERRRERWIELAALALGAALQLLVFYYPVTVRSHELVPGTLSALLFVRHAVLPLAGPLAAKDVGFQVFQTVMEDGAGPPVLLASGLTFGLLLFVSLRRWRQPAAWLVVPALLLAVVSYWGAIARPASLLLPLVGERYSFVPNVMIGLALISLATTAGGRLAKAAAGLLLVEALVAVIFFTGPKAEMTDGPSWAGEVAAWRADPQHRLRIWPGGWTVDLAPGSPRCPAVAGPADPEYCDGAWEAMEKRALRAM